MKEKQKQQILELAAQGKSQVEIAKICGVTRGGVQYVLSRVNVNNVSDPADADDPDADFENFEDADDLDDPDFPDEEFDDDPEPVPPVREEKADDVPRMEPMGRTPPEEPASRKKELDAVALKVADALSGEYDKIIRMLGEVNRGVLENCTTGFDRATRMLQASASRLDELEKKRLQEKTRAEELTPPSVPLTLHVIFTLMGYLLVFLAGGLASYVCYGTPAARWMFGILSGTGAGWAAWFFLSGGKNEMVKAFLAAGLAAAPCIFFAGYSFFLMEKPSLAVWSVPLLLAPLGAAAALVFAIRKHLKYGKEKTK